MTTTTIVCGDATEKLKQLEDGSVHCCVTSPPYWGLRAYQGDRGMIGRERTMAEYLSNTMVIYREIKRVLRDDGTFWLVIGDSYSRSDRGGGAGLQRTNIGSMIGGFRAKELPPKNLMLMPFRVAVMLQDDGWVVRSRNIWHKPNPMPESVRDRPTSAYEEVFLFSKSQRYWYDADAVRTEHSTESQARLERAHRGYSPDGQVPHKGILAPRSAATRIPTGWDTNPGAHGTIHREGRGKGGKADPWHGGKFNRHGHERHHHEWRTVAPEDQTVGANLRNVWTIPNTRYSGKHYATFPRALAERCILPGCPMGGLVLDPFAGSGTVGAVAARWGRDSHLIEISSKYCGMIRERVAQVLPLFNTIRY